MSLTDAQRLQIYEAYKTEHGEALAEALMTTIPPFDWNELATKTDLARLEAEFARLEATTTAGIAQLGTDLRFEFKYELGQTELRLQRSFMNALWASQGAFAAVVAVAIALATIFG